MDDGVGLIGGLQTDFVNPNALKNSISSTTLGVIASSCTPPAASAAACSNQIVDYMSGLSTASPYPRKTKDGPNVIGFILHSTPQVRSGIPSEFLRDPTYTAFTTALAKRDTMIYTSTNDGFFHGFYLSPGDNVSSQLLDGSSGRNPERWGFVPPAALQSFVTQYPTNVANANPSLPPPMNATPELDGAPVLRDVGATRDGSRALNNSSSSNSYYPYSLERKKNAAPNETHTWRTVMAQAFGTRRGGYFGMDVTTPNIVSGNKDTGPKFLWQLTRDKTGKELFSPGDPAPLLTTVFVDLSAIDPGIASSSETTREVQVAVLSGGAGVGPGTNRTCTNAIGAVGPLDPNNPSGVKFRPSLPCYTDPQSIAGRSLTIVRMDTGQIIRTFRPTGVASPVTFDSKVVTNIDIPAPISGQPAAYPGQAGQIADRIFVGDAEGRIWRVDVSNPDPSKWTMNVFFDLYWDAAAAPAPNPQPIQLQPALSVDDNGQITIAVATGDQQNLTYLLSEKNYSAAIVETVTTVAGVKTFNALLKWRHQFDNGEHALGPFALFDRNIYYTTFQPPAVTGINCNAGGISWIRGENYLKPNSSGLPTIVGGDPAPTFPQQVTDAVVTGAAVRQMPSCAAGVANGGSTDAFLGYGNTTTVTSVTPGAFQVFYQKSNAATNSKNEPTPIPVATSAVTPPRIPVRIDSWAPIIE
jgi:type IV pilus assembly protein PilY1